MKHLHRILNSLFFTTLLTAALFTTTATALTFETVEPAREMVVEQEPSEEKEQEQAALSAVAEDFSWSLENGVLTISGHGDMPDYNSKYNGNTLQTTAPWGVEISKVVILDGITSIGDSVFRGCTGLTDITIPDSVTSMGSYAFFGCTGLTNITFSKNLENIGEQAFNKTAWFDSQPDGIVYINNIAVAYKGTLSPNSSLTIQQGTTTIGEGAFSHCFYLGNITIPDSVTSIQDSAFASCYLLNNVKLPECIVSIGRGAFCECRSLTDIQIPDNINYVGLDAFYNTGWYANEPDGLVYVGKTLYTYKGEMSQNNANVSIRQGTVSICDKAFSGCNNLTSIVIPESVTNIGSSAFNGCTGLMSITIPDSVTSIDNYTFSGCTSLTSIVIPYSVTSIGNYAFRGCTGLTNITIPSSVTNIDVSVFEGCTGLTSIFIPESVTNIGTSAFKGCTGLTNVTIPSSLTNINGSVFEGCTSLTSITIPDRVTNIGASAFSGCTALASITMGSCVKSVSEYAFKECRNVTSLYLTDIAAWCQIQYTVNFTTHDDDGEMTRITDEWTSHPLYASYQNKKLYLNGKEVTDLIIPQGVSRIPSYAFKSFSNVQSVSFPSSLRQIDKNAFSNCTGLKDVYYKKSISSIVIEKTGNGALTEATAHMDYCGEDLTWSLDKSSGVLTISGTGKMYEYSSNTTPWYNDCSTVKSVVLSDGVTSIGGSAFFGCTNLTSIVIPDSVTSIGTSAFSDCTGLTSITIPSGVTSIEQFVFSDCTSLISITIPNRVTRIRRGAFSDCTGLTSITISDSVTSIEDFAFSGCTGLVSITIPGSVKSIGNSPFSGCTSLSEIILEKGITKIDSGIFRNCTGLTSITIPDSVTSISEAAFSGCSNLKDIYYTGSPSQWKQISIGSNNNEFRRATVHYVKFGENLKWSFDKETGTLTISGTGEMYAFNYAKEFPWHGERSEITSVVLEEGVANIGGSVFYGCTNLANVVIPSSVTSIGNSAFSGCTGLSSVSIPDSVTSIGSYAFSGCTALTSLKIPEGVTTIAGYTFDSCTNLTSLSIPNSLTSVDTYAFKDCTSLKDIYYNGTPSEWRQGNAYYNYVIREASIHYARCGKNVDWSFDKKTGTLTISGNGAIEDIDEKDCTPWHDERSNIQAIVIKNGVTDIGNCVFCGYTNLINITIPSTVKRLGDSAFGECSNLEFVDIQDLASWCGMEFGWYMANPLSLDAILYVNGKKAVDLIIPEGVTEISPYAFVGYESLASVTFPNSLQSIGEKAFAQCTNLKNVVIPDSVKAIRCNAFYACTNLSSISIGSGVEYIEDNFSECPNLTAVHIKDVAAWCGIEFTSEAANPLCCTDATLYVNGEAVTDIVIPDGVQSISCGAFWGYDKMTSVTIPASVSSIPSAFAVSEDSNFNAVYINDLAAWCSIDFSYPEENPLIYAHNLYVNGKLLEQLTIPDGTTTFSAPYAFSGANCIKSVVIPKTLTNIAKNTFYACNNIKDIYYTGSAEEWESVRIAANNGTLSEATVHIAYEVVFDANTDEPVSGLSETTFAYDSFTLPTAIPSRVNYKFLGWSTVPDGKAICQPGDMVEISADTTFYAVWAEADKAVLSGITLKNTSYDPISAIPVGGFIAEVALTNNTYNGVCNVLLATYDKDGRMLHIRYLYATPVVGQTISFGTELSNADGKIAKIKAFVLSDLRAFTILGEAAELTKA